MLLLLTSYLSERKQYVKGDIYDSIILIVLIRDPQGTGVSSTGTLDPLLFNIYIPVPVRDIPVRSCIVIAVQFVKKV